MEEQTAHHNKVQQTQVFANNKTLVDQYAKMVIDEKESMQQLLKYVVADSYFMKQKFIQPLTQASFEAMLI